LFNPVSPPVGSAARLIDANVVCGSPLHGVYGIRRVGPLYAAFDPEEEHQQYGEQDRRARGAMPILAADTWKEAGCTRGNKIALRASPY